MPIPKIIFQTYKTARLSFITRFYVWLSRYRNPGYEYRFYDDAAIEAFFSEKFDAEILHAYKRLDIGAAKADFFRYAVLYEYGGIYIDIDGYCGKGLDKMIQPGDEAIITHERNPGIYAQYALVFAKGHPILQRCIHKIMENIHNERYVNDIHRLTGPTVFTEAVNDCIADGTAGKYRFFGVDYEGFLKSKYILHSGLFKKREKWRKAQMQRPALKPATR